MSLHRVTWPHEMVYMAEGQLAIYDDLSITLFVSVYLTVMAMEKAPVKAHMEQNLQELMSDAELYC